MARVRYDRGMKIHLTSTIREAINMAQEKGSLAVFELPHFQVNRPEEALFGEYTSNIALMIAKQAGQNPRAVAEILREVMLQNDAEKQIFEKIEVAGPGHLNFFLSQKTLGQIVDTILTQGNLYGSTDIGRGKR